MAALTISENDGTVSYTIGVTPAVGPYTIDFPYFFVSELVVTKIVAGVQTTLVLTTNYTVSGTPADDGFSAGSITLVAPLANATLTISRALSTSKATNFPTSGPISIKTMNTLFSRLFSWAQDIRRLYGGSVHFPSGEEALNSQALPAASRKGYIPFYDAATGALSQSNQTLAVLEAGSVAAAASAAAALVSQGAAATSATNAATSATNASNSASAAATSASNAATSATNAANSATSSAASAASGAASIATSAASAAAAAVSAGNASTSASNAATSEVNAGTSAAASAASATTSSTQATTATSQATAAAASATAAALSAAALVATSATSLLIAVASKTFTTQTGKQFAAGQFISAVSNANNANFMHGQVTSYSSTTLVVNVTDIGGAGTLADWNLSVSGSQGPAGASASGISAATATGTVNAITATYSPVLTLTNLTLCALVSSGANTSATPTFSPDGLTARTITARGGGSLAPGDIGAAGAVVMLEYNLANTRWELLNPSLSIAPNGMFVNSQTVVADYTVASGYNALSAGPITINGGVTVTVTSGSSWAVV